MKKSRSVSLTSDAKEKLGKVSTATLTSQLILHGFKNTFLNGVEPLKANSRMIGYAVTVRFVPAREDMPAKVADLSVNPQRLAVESVGEEDVLVMDARGDGRGAVFGDILALRIAMLGAAGFVTDGSVRDTPACENIDLPIYLKEKQATRSNLYHHPADWNVTIGCGGVLIEPGDVIVGDREGVVAIPAHVAESVAHASYEQELREMHVIDMVKSGKSTVGIYPAGDATMAEFEAWRKEKGI
ncbi:MAG: 5-oxopent-3-ene-1,2,5-tricarboxylate decarboxylase [Cellvibrionaceae bacterium]|jgi:5-oxopent-3-ene-1,2,5-tricarboxylate decarboxylase/2-hydroxyhepta-2,4-diene-1,7-dioate isomerase